MESFGDALAAGPGDALSKGDAGLGGSSSYGDPLAGGSGLSTAAVGTRDALAGSAGTGDSIGSTAPLALTAPPVATEVYSDALSAPAYEGDDAVDAAVHVDPRIIAAMRAWRPEDVRLDSEDEPAAEPPPLRVPPAEVVRDFDPPAQPTVAIGPARGGRISAGLPRGWDGPPLPTSAWPQAARRGPMAAAPAASPAAPPKPPAQALLEQADPKQRAKDEQLMSDAMARLERRRAASDARRARKRTGGGKYVVYLIAAIIVLQLLVRLVGLLQR